MKNPKTHSHGITSFLLAAGLFLSVVPLASADSTNQTITIDGKSVEENIAFNFGDKPASGAAFHVSPPKIELPKDVTMKLGGDTAVEMLKNSLQSLLFDTGRLKVQKSDKADQYEVRATMTDFKIGSGQTNASVKASFLSALKKSVVDKFAGGLAPIANMAEVDWSKDETRVLIKCGVLIQLFDAGGTMVAKGTSDVSKDTTVKEIRTKMAGVDFSQHGPPLQNLVEYQTKIMEYGLGAALSKMMPQVDELLAHATAPAVTAVAATEKPAATPSGDNGGANQAATLTPGNSTAAAHPAFCSNCGTKVTGPGKFCSSCGTKLSP